tara:strand:+ start:6399 stop:6701 length:303 start_codon:yes stop_codon:yes gene_type:complete
LIGHRPLDIAQRLLERGGQTLGLGRRHHVIGPPHEQLVREMVAQARQGVTDRRLAEADRGPGPRDAPLAHERVEYTEQVQVEGGKIHLSDGADTKLQFGQ